MRGSVGGSPWTRSGGGVHGPGVSLFGLPLLTDKIIALHINRFEGTEPLSGQMHRSCQYAYFRLKSLASSCKEQHFDDTYCGRTSETLTLKGLAIYNSSDHG